MVLWENVIKSLDHRFLYLCNDHNTLLCHRVALSIKWVKACENTYKPQRLHKYKGLLFQEGWKGNNNSNLNNGQWRRYGYPTCPAHQALSSYLWAYLGVSLWTYRVLSYSLFWTLSFISLIRVAIQPLEGGILSWPSCCLPQCPPYPSHILLLLLKLYTLEVSKRCNNFFKCSLSWGHSMSI